MNEEPDTEALPRSVLGRRLLAVLRRHFVKEVRALEYSPDAGQLLTVFACFEQLYTYLESDWSKRFAERLGGAGGLELVVEVAHDFRSPLTSILFLAETLKKARSGPVTPLQERQLGLIYSAAFGLSGVASRRGGTGPRGRPPGRPGADALLDRRHLRVGARHHPADRRGEGPRDPACCPRRPIFGSGIRWPCHGCCST